MHIKQVLLLRSLPIALLALVSLLGHDTARAHGGEDHGEAAPAQSTAPATQGESLTTHGSTELFELLLKYPAADAGEDTRLRLFLADFATNRPIEGARFTLAFKPAGVEIVEPPRMISPGIYEMVARFPGDTLYSLVATVSAGSKTDFVEVRNIYSGAAATRFLSEHGGPAAPHQAESKSKGWVLRVIALAALGTLVVLIVLRRRGRRRAGRRDGRDGGTGRLRDGETER